MWCKEWPVNPPLSATILSLTSVGIFTELCIRVSFQQGSKVFLDMAYSHLSKTLVTASADRHVRLYDPRATGE